MMTLEGGGSERVMVTIMNNIDRKKYKICLLLMQKKGFFLESLRSDIDVVDFKCTQIRYMFPKLVKWLRSEQPDIVFSTIGSLNLCVTICSFFTPRKIKHIARESSIPSIGNQVFRIPAIQNFLYRQLYPSIDRIICQSQFMKADLVENFGISANQIEVNYNPVEVDEIKKKSLLPCPEMNKDEYNLLAVGRLNKIKRFHLLIDSFSLIPDKKVKLTILGIGAQEEPLKKRTRQLGIESRVSFLGFQKNPYRFMKKADALIVTSKYEGYPNVILEANLCGTPAIAFDVPGGINEIIREGMNGILVEDHNINALAQAIQRGQHTDWSEEIMFRMIHERHAKRTILKSYYDLFENLIQLA